MTAEANERVEQKHYLRFSVPQRLQHILLIASFTILALTGLPQKYAAEGIAQSLIGLLGGIETIRVIHRVAATTLMVVAIYHGGEISYKLFVLGKRANMLPTVKDVQDAWHWLRYNLGLGRHYPRMPHFNFSEKAEYLALVWGTIIMIITGFMLWNPITTNRLLPAAWIPAARAAHGAEAVLAVLSIIIWHFYHVHIRHFNKSMFTGTLSHKEMEEEHGAALDAIEAGKEEPKLPTEVIQRRQRLFWPYAVIMTILLVGGLVFFITFEETALTTTSSRLSEPGAVSLSVDAAAGIAAEGAALWQELDCQTCHGADARGVPELSSIPLAGTEISFRAFAASVRRGPADMPAYSPEQIGDEQLAHLWAWLSSLDQEAAQAR
ncbi:MAG: hypothetical protein GXY36_01255 [Chloroflexi bacterium]|nr:hypothetical protein [Chloroflexota bacterium]